MNSQTRGLRARIHRGAHEIGGSCVEVSDGQRRLVLDIGTPLDVEPGADEGLPDVPGLYDTASGNVDGVVISHPHLDHYGVIDRVHPSIPVCMGEDAARIVQAAHFFSPRGPVPSPSHHLRHRTPFRLGPFEITPYLVDHSAFDSYAVTVKAPGGTLLYTGDFRGHGRKARLFQEMLADPPPNVDTLLMEGTHVAPADAAVPADPETETDLERAMSATFAATKGLAVVVSSAQNIDRIVTVYKAARAAGRTSLIDLYTATVASAARGTIPQPGFPDLGVYVPRRQRVLVKTAGEFERTHSIRPWRIFPEQARDTPDRYVMLTQSSAVYELVSDGALADGVVVWSLWPGYLEKGSGKRLQEMLGRSGVPVVHHHTSGHACVRDLCRLVHAVQPQRVVPIHTEGAAFYSRYFAATEQRNDGEWWFV